MLPISAMMDRVSDRRAVLGTRNSVIRSGYSNWNLKTISRGDPAYSCRKKPRRTFPFDFRSKFTGSLAWWKAPLKTFTELGYILKLAFFIFRKTIFVIHGNDLSPRPVIIFEKYSPEGRSVLKYHWSFYTHRNAQFCLWLVFVPAPSIQLDTWFADWLLWLFCMFWSFGEYYI